MVLACVRASWDGLLGVVNLRLGEKGALSQDMLLSL